MELRRVVITGLGTINALGHDVSSSFDGMVRGECGIDNISRFDTSNHSVTIAAEVKGFDPSTAVNPKDVKRVDLFIQYGCKAAKEAMKDSGLSDAPFYNLDRFGISSASGIGGLITIEYNTVLCSNRGPRKLSPFFIPASLGNMLGGFISIEHSLKGPNISSGTACAASTHAITAGAKSIMLNGADAMLVVGSEATICPAGIGGFASMKALCTRNDEPKKASRPFDKNRSGFVMGEGSGALVLEEYESAKKRGANIYAELIGFGESGDANHITSPAPEGEGAYRAMKMALDMAGVSNIDYINAHGTSTKINDWYETMAIKRLFKDKIAPISSIKGQIGHCLGAAGAIEAIASLKAIQNDIMPPTINYETKDDDCDLDYIPNEAREAKLNTVMSNSFGFGGTNGVVIFRGI